MAALPAARATAAAGDLAPLTACSNRLARLAAHVASARERALARCSLEALRCPQADTACRDGARRRCGQRLAGLAGVIARSSRAGDACLVKLGPGLLDQLDGLGYGLLAAFCPHTAPLVDGHAAMACQQAALVCTADRTVAVLAPRTAALLARLGVAPGGSPDCLVPLVCGDGVLDEAEECDQGVANSDVLPDRCRTDCLEPGCGDGVVDEDEECDDANAVDGDGCDVDCLAEENGCGNGVLEEGEECDDGNGVDGDGCDADCLIDVSVCGDGVESDDEECDDGPGNSDRLPDRCRTTCRLPSCGDGVVDPNEGEECEPPGTLLCTSDCEWLLPLPVARQPSATPLQACARGIIRAGLRTFAKTRTAVAGCARAAARCVLGRREAGDRCATAAERRCTVAAAEAARVRARAHAAAVRACDLGPAGLPLATMLDAEAGLGFRDVASRCPFVESAAPTTADLLDCVTARAGCLGERAVAQAIPRAYELVSEVADPDALFPCIPDPDLAPDPGSPGAAFLR